MVEFSDLAFHFRALKGLDDDALEEVLDFLFGKTVTREKAELASLFRAHRAYSTVAQSRDSSTGNILIDVFGLIWLTLKAHEIVLIFYSTPFRQLNQNFCYKN